jgi:hypothetical protein
MDPCYAEDLICMMGMAVGFHTGRRSPTLLDMTWATLNLYVACIADPETGDERLAPSVAPSWLSRARR